MSVNAAQDRWLNKIVEQLSAMAGTRHEVLEDGRHALEVAYNGESRKMFVTGAAADYRDLKEQYGRLRETLAELGITEDMTVVARRQTRRPASADMVAARAGRKKEVDAWKALCRTIRRAEDALDVEFEIAQMQDYY